MKWFRRESVNIVGRWKLDPSDSAAAEEFGNVVIDFDDLGNLNYTIFDGDKAQLILMTYRLEKGAIITDQPSHPRPERTAMAISKEGILTLWFGGESSRWVRVEDWPHSVASGL